MNLTLRRKWLTDQSTIGELYVDGAFFSYTLEDVLRPEGVKIKRETAIPAGRYEVIMGWSNRFQKPMPRLCHVPNFDGILIHAGNTKDDTSGCILVGKMRGDNRITESRSAFNRLYNLLAEAALSEKIWIEICNPANLPSELPQNAPGTKKATQIPIRPEKREIDRVAPKIPASQIDLTPRSAVSVPTAENHTVVGQSVKSGNTLPISTWLIATVCNILTAKPWLAVAVITTVLLLVLWYEFKPQRRKHL